MDYKHLPIEFEVESVSGIYVPAENSANVVEYPSIIKLRYQKNNADNGKLLATFEKWGDTYPIYESIVSVHNTSEHSLFTYNKTGTHHSVSAV